MSNSFTADNFMAFVRLCNKFASHSLEKWKIFIFRYPPSYQIKIRFQFSFFLVFRKILGEEEEIDLEGKLRRKRRRWRCNLSIFFKFFQSTEPSDFLLWQKNIFEFDFSKSVENKQTKFHILNFSFAKFEAPAPTFSIFNFILFFL